MMEALLSLTTSVLTIVTRLKIPEDGNLHEIVFAKCKTQGLMSIYEPYWKIISKQIFLKWGVNRMKLVQGG
jgi:hypothetical protein